MIILTDVMVSLDNIHVIGSWYMSFHGGYKPRPKPFTSYFKKHDLSPERIFFLGNRLIDMKLASRLKRKLKCEVFKCLIVRDGKKSLASRYDDKMVTNLWQAREEIKKFKPDLVMSDFDNTLVHAGYSSVERVVEKTRFWEKYGNNLLLRGFYAFFSQLAVLLKKEPYESKYDNTAAFIKTLKTPLVIHTMSPEVQVKRLLNILI